jgi:hypothetical protein
MPSQAGPRRALARDLSQVGCAGYHPVAGGTQTAMPASFDDVFASLLSKMLARLAGPANPTDKPPPRRAIRSVRLIGPAGRIPFHLSYLAGENSPAEVSSSHIHLWPYAAPAPAFRRWWRQRAFVSLGVREVGRVSPPLDSGVAIRASAPPVWFPCTRAVSGMRRFGQASFIGSRWRVAEPDAGEPMDAKHSDLPACAYRTRLMLSGWPQKADRSEGL